jgi:FMN phosphatase YigB (HAD superfamily)
MPRYTTVLFDMFDTLVRFNRERLPLLRVNGREVRSSVAEVYPAAAARFPGVTLDAFYDAFLGSYRDAESRRGVENREVSAPDRFAFCYTRLGMDPAGVPAEVTQQLIGLHAASLVQAAEPMPGRPELFEWLRGRYRLGLVSNFDYSPTVVRILEEAGIRERFEALIVSDAVGWRKPSPKIFEAVFAALGVEAGECLFVGDRPELDVAGAQAVGMDVAWLNPGNEALPEGLPSPTYTLSHLSELRAALEPGSG